MVIACECSARMLFICQTKEHQFFYLEHAIVHTSILYQLYCLGVPVL